MAWPWSRSRNKQPAAETAPSKKENTTNPDAVHDAILRGIGALEAHRPAPELDRVLLTLYESEGTPTSGRWIEGSETNYYPFERLDPDEQRMIRMEKTYTTVAFVSENPFGLVKYAGPGVEVYERTRINPMLPKLKPEANLFYVSKGGAYTGDGLKELCVTFANSGWTPEAVDAHVQAAIGDHRTALRKEMRQAGVEESLGRLDARERTGIDDLLFQVRAARMNSRQRWASHQAYLSPSELQPVFARMDTVEAAERHHYRSQQTEE